MPRQKNSQDRYGEWMSRIQERERALDTRRMDWNKYLSYYRQEPDDANTDDDNVWLNYIFSLSRVILPSIYYRNPDVLVLPRQGTQLAYAKLLEQLLNYQLEYIDYEIEARKVVFDTLICGIGVMKFGYAPVLKTGKRTKVDPYAMVAEESIFEEFAKKKHPEGFEVDQRIHDSCPFAIRVSPEYFLIDPMATTLADARWVVHKILRPVDDVKSSKMYSKGLTSGMEGNLRLHEEAALNQVSGGFNDYRAGSVPRIYDNLVMLYEVWDRETGNILVLDSYHMDDGEKKFLREEPNPYEFDDFPFEILTFNPDPKSPYGVSDASTWFNPAEALNLLNTMQYTHVKRFNRKYLVKTGALKAEQMDALQSPRDGAIVEVDDDVPSQAITALGDAAVTPDLYALRDVLRNELTSLSGVTEQRRGGSEKAKTATEASIIEQQAKVRDSDRLYLVSNFVKKCVQKILRLDRQFLDSDYVGFITGPVAMELWQTFAPRILEAEVDVRVRVGSSAFMSREVRTKQLLDFFNLAMSAQYPSGAPVANIAEFVNRLGEAMDIPEPQKLILPDPAAGMPMPPPGGPGGPPGGGNGQAFDRRGGGTNLGDMLSGVQNLGVRRTPNPTNAGSS